jgi:citrate lyase subunit gamma (acyl carrier protein)
MKILKEGTAGTLESSDALVTVETNDGGGIQIELKSPSESRFGRQIRGTVAETLERLDVKDARVRIQDRSALDCTIRARVIAAAYRAAGIRTFNWEEL